MLKELGSKGAPPHPSFPFVWFLRFERMADDIRGRKGFVTSNWASTITNGPRCVFPPPPVPNSHLSGGGSNQNEGDPRQHRDDQLLLRRRAARSSGPCAMGACPSRASTIWSYVIHSFLYPFPAFPFFFAFLGLFFMCICLCLCGARLVRSQWYRTGKTTTTRRQLQPDRGGHEDGWPRRQGVRLRFPPLRPLAPFPFLPH